MLFFREHLHHSHALLMQKKVQKTTKFQMSNQPLGVNQLLGVTPNCWPTNFFLRFSSQASCVPLMHMMKKVLISSFSTVFHRFRQCKHMHKHAFASQNTQQTQVGSDSILLCSVIYKFVTTNTFNWHGTIA